MPKGKPKNTAHTVKRLWHYLSSYKWRLVMVIFCMLFSTFTALAGSYMLRPIINNIAAAGTPAAERVSYLAMILIVLACIYAIGVLSNYLQGRLMLSISQNAVEKLRNDLFDKIQTLPVRYFDNNSTGEVMSRFTNDIDNIDMMINNTITNLISGAVTLVGTFVMMVYTNIILTLITVAFVPVFLKAGMAIASRSSKYYSAQQAALGAVNGYIEETVTGSKVIKVFNHE